MISDPAHACVVSPEGLEPTLTDDLRVDALLGQLVAEAPERTIAEGPGA